STVQAATRPSTFPYTTLFRSQRRLITEAVGRDYIVQTQLPGYEREAGWLNADERPAFIAKNKLRFLRDYQKKALNAIQDAVAERSEEHTSELQSRENIVCRLL